MSRGNREFRDPVTGEVLGWMKRRRVVAVNEKECTRLEGDRVVARWAKRVSPGRNPDNCGRCARQGTFENCPVQETVREILDLIRDGG